MGTTAEKLQYLNETKGMIKTAIADKGVEIADTDTFRSYVDKIGEIPTTVVEEVIKAEKYGMTIDNVLGDVDENGILLAPQPFSFVGTGIKGLDTIKFYEYFANSNIENFTMPDIVTVTKTSAFSYVCQYASKLKSVSFPNLETVEADSCFSFAFSDSAVENVNFSKLISTKGNSSFTYTFKNCPNLRNVTFENLESVSGSYAFNNTFSYSSNLETVSFPKLKTINGYFRNAFENCTNLKSVDFSAVEKFTNSNIFGSAFKNCTSLTKISFPKFNYINYNGLFGSSSSDYGFIGCEALTEIHFRADMQTEVETMDGYADKWGAVNATIYFDL